MENLIEIVRKADTTCASYEMPFKNAVGSRELRMELLEKVGNSDFVFNFAYTNYGGTLLDKAMIAFANKYYPECIVSENTSWNGENAFVFGELAKIIGESNDIIYADYKANFEDFVMEMENDLEIKAFIEVSSQFEDANDAFDWLSEHRSGYYQCEPNYLDYNEAELIDTLQDNGFVLKAE